MVSDVGTVLVPVPAVNDRLLVRLIVRFVPAALYGTVITTGDQLPAAVPPPFVAGFEAAHVVVLPVTTAPQL